MTAAAPPASVTGAAARGKQLASKKKRKLTPLQAARRAQRKLNQRYRGESGTGPDVVKLLGVHRFAVGHIEHWRLRNGLTVVLAPDSAALVIAYHTWIAAGSRDEGKGEGGVAHLLEHLMFKGTREHPPGTFDRLLERHGSAPNAATWLDYTMYQQTVPPQALAEVARLEADRLSALAIHPVGLKAELEVVLNERRETVDNDPDALLDEAFATMVYGQHPYGRPTLGTARSIRGLTQRTVQRFYERHYRPANATLVLAGAVESIPALATVIDAYGAATVTDAPAPAAKREPTPPVAVRGPRAATVVVDTASDRLRIGWLTTGGDHADHAALTVAAEIIGGSPSARLHRALVDTGIAADVMVEMPALAGPAVFEIQVQVMPGKSAGQARDAVLDVMRSLQTGQPITRSELGAARNRMRRRWFNELAAVDGRADALGHAVVTFGDPSHPHLWWKRAIAVREPDVQAAVKRWLVAAHRVELVGRSRRNGASR